LLQGKTGAISLTTKIYALLFGSMGRSDDSRSVIGIARLQCSRTRWQKRDEEHRNNGERLLVISHGQSPLEVKAQQTLVVQLVIKASPDFPPRHFSRW
jgi:hypothetical protein